MVFMLGKEESFSQGYTDKEMQAYSEAVSEIERRALLPKSRQEIIRGSLRAYLKNLDRFSDYLSPEEYSAFKQSQSGQYVGIGMDIEKNQSGHFVCFPYPDSPAYKAGIRSGDILIAIDGMGVFNKTVFQIASKAMGEKNTAVNLKIKRQSDRDQEISVIRDTIVSKTVGFKEESGFSILSISRFSPGTSREIKLNLGDIQNRKALIIDLRKNPGGDLYAAIDSAMLFLEKERKIVDVASRDVEKSFTSTSSPINLTTPLYIWQDDFTASAAEVFTAALVQNKRAESVGRKTFGKGVQQKVIELSDGSALFLTTAYLKTPDGLLYHEIGLQPTHPLKTDNGDFSAYLSKMEQLVSDNQGGNKAIKQIQPEAAPVPEKPVSIQPASKQQGKSSPDTSETPLAENYPSNWYFICFDENFDTEKEADIWYATIRNSVNTDKSLYLFQSQTDNGSKFFVCLGSYKDKKTAEKKREKTSRAMNAAMFIKTIDERKLKKEEQNMQKPHSPSIEQAADSNLERKENHSQDFPETASFSLENSWSVQTGSYSRYESVISAIEKIREEDTENKFHLWVQIIRGDREIPLAEEKRFEEYGVKVLLSKDSNSELDTAYRLFIGPYNFENEAFLNFLKQSGIVEKEAYWIKLRR